MTKLEATTVRDNSAELHYNCCSTAA